VLVTVPIQLSHKRRQLFRHRGANGVGEFGLQSGRKRLQELHRVEGDGGQAAHRTAPTDLPWPNRSGRAPYVVNTTEVVWFRGGRQDFCGAGVRGADNELAISKGAQTFLRPVPFAVPTRARALVTTLS
jgi:hypothetical protein